ncbi:MAG: protein of unknown function DUF1016 [Ktedonobacterales bacterium]|nr:MAG: protein of unknown function DUF1016 [Ktedonobacterales bacterium]
MSEPAHSDYPMLLQAIKERIRSAQYAALKAVNRELISLYWDIGRMIVERLAVGTWGGSIVETLARDLQADLVGISGFSATNLWRMKRFYELYTQQEQLALLVREVSWSHNVVVMERCRDMLEREFYLRMARKFGWTKSILILQIENQTYQKTLLNQTNFEQTLPDHIHQQAKLTVKDEYTFDFLELADEHTERQLEQALLANVESFLREMGGAFTLVGSQYRLEVGDKEYFIDLLLFHRRLKCLVALELKIGEFLPEYVGKMQFYLALLDDKARIAGESPSIGIILCKDKDKTIVEYALKESNKPIGVATYHIVTSPPAALQGELPSPEQIAKLLAGIE